MKKLVLAAAFLVAAYVGLAQLNTGRESARPVTASAGGVENGQAVARAYTERRSNLQVEGEGIVSKILADDNDGSRHQRFIIRLDSGQSLLVAHNIDFAPRLSALKAGDAVSFSGEYEWNPKGGVLHWTHRDPDSRHPSGWLKHNGRIYQ